MATIRYTLGGDYNPANSGLAELIYGRTDLSSNAFYDLLATPDYELNYNYLWKQGSPQTLGDLLAAYNASLFIDFSDKTINVSLTSGNFGDVIRSGSGSDTLNGGAGNDVLEGGAGADDLRGGDGTDTVSYEHAGAAVDVYLGIEGTAGDASGDTYTGIESIRGSDVVAGAGSIADVLVGNSNRNVIEGGKGADFINGLGGNDVASYEHSSAGVDVTVNSAFSNFGGDAEGDALYNIRDLLGSAHADTLTGDGQDNTLDGGAGTDTLTGGTGNDSYFVDNAGDTVVETNGTMDGIDTVFASVDVTLDDTQAIEVLRANSGSTGRALTGNGSANTVLGGTGADTLDGAGANDVLVGGAGTDILKGGSGADTLNGGAGADDMTGGTGNDLYYVSDAGDAVHEGSGGGTDTVLTTVDYTLGSGEQVETLRVSGATGRTLTGNELNNNLVGNTGADTLVGAGGRDTLTGGAGLDTFAFKAVADSRASAYDTIVDFSHAQGDKIDLSAIATGRSDGAFTFDDDATAFSGQAGELIAVQKTGYVLVQGDTDGNGLADFAIRVNGTFAFDSGDFVL